MHSIVERDTMRQETVHQGMTRQWHVKQSTSNPIPRNPQAMVQSPHRLLRVVAPPMTVRGSLILRCALSG